jgi:hypothetical protein
MDNNWIKETMELQDDLQKQHDKIEAELSGLLSEEEEIKSQMRAVDSLIRLYRDKHKNLPQPLQDVPHGYFGTKTYPEILVEIATKSNNYLKVLDAVETMVQAGVNKNRRAIQANTYAALGRLVQAGHFVRIQKGEYRYTNGFQKPKVIVHQRHTRIKSGVQQAVNELKDKNPQMTKKEVLNHLLRIGFDFKGKKPVNAVNIVWAKLGYSKEGKQQVLPDLILKDRNNQTTIVEVKALPR